MVKMVQFTSDEVMAEVKRLMRDPSNDAGIDAAEKARQTYIHWIALGALYKVALRCAAADKNERAVEQGAQAMFSALVMAGYFEPAPEKGTVQ